MLHSPLPDVDYRPVPQVDTFTQELVDTLRRNEWILLGRITHLISKKGYG